MSFCAELCVGRRSALAIGCTPPQNIGVMRAIVMALTAAGFALEAAPAIPSGIRTFLGVSPTSPGEN